MRILGFWLVMSKPTSFIACTPTGLICPAGAEPAERTSTAYWPPQWSARQTAEASFDAVPVVYLHVAAAERAAILARAAAALADGGTLLVVGHDRANLTAGVGGPQDPALLYTPEEIVAEMGGLRVLRAETARRRVPLDAGVAEALDTVVVAVRAA